MSTNEKNFDTEFQELLAWAKVELSKITEIYKQRPSVLDGSRDLDDAFYAEYNRRLGLLRHKHEASIHKVVSATIGQQEPVAVL